MKGARMLARLLSALAGTGADPANAAHLPAENQPAELPPEAMRFAPMVPLRPPPAQNDDGMRRVCEAVETALREAGHLS